MTFTNPKKVCAGWLVALVLLPFPPADLMGGQEGRPAFNGPAKRISRNGHIRLRWTSPDPGAAYEVQQALTADFQEPESIYQGPDRATFVSGLKDGIYYYRFRAGDGRWSDTLTLTVKHHSLQLAWVLSGVGAIVFMLTVFVVLKGATNPAPE